MGLNHAPDFLSRKIIRRDATKEQIDALMARDPDILYVLFKSSDGGQIDFFLRPHADPTRALSVEQPVTITGIEGPGGSGARNIGSLVVGYENWIAVLIQNIRRDVLIFGTILAATGICISILMAYFFTRPVYSVIHGMEKVESGEMNIHVPETRKDELGRLAQTFNQMVRGLRAKQELSPYVSESAWKEAHRRAELGASGVIAQKKRVTVIFTDICAFTPLSEGLEPAAIVRMLNEYFDHMTNIVQNHRGSIDKFIGDAIMGLFDGPAAEAALDAVSAGIEMQKTVRDMAYHNIHLSIRVGINTGDVVMGDIGSLKSRRDYTCIGDTVNRAQRIESVCEPGQVTIGEDTYQLVKDMFPAAARDIVKLKGISEPVPIYRIRV